MERICTRLDSTSTLSSRTSIAGGLLTGLIAAWALTACNDARAADGEVDVALPTDVGGAEPGLVMHACRHYRENRFWCAASVHDGNGAPVTGLQLDDFTITESLIGPDGVEIETTTATFEQPEYQFGGPGFWARAVTDQQIDLIVVYDRSASMSDHIEGIRTAVRETIDALVERKVDFRVALVAQSESVAALGSLAGRFRGVMEYAELMADVTAMGISTEGWSPAVTYDVLLFLVGNRADGLAFRPQAEKHVVLVSDTMSKSMYGAGWYPPDSTATNERAVELLYDGSGVNILQSLDGRAGNTHLGSYCHRDYNPKAWPSPEALGRVVDPIGWPLDAEELLAQLDLKDGPVVDSTYYFAWYSGLDRSSAGADHRVEIQIETNDPTEGRLTATASAPAVLPSVQVVVELTDARGAPVAFADVDAFTRMGDRMELLESGGTVDGRAVFSRIPCGEVVLWTRGYSHLSYNYASLRYQDRRTVDPCPDGALGASFAFTAETADVPALLAQSRGLLYDLERWGVTDRPFVGFVAEARAWLDQVEADGVDHLHFERIRRFNIGLAGYLNSAHYAEQEIAGATQDFIDAAKELRALIERLTEDTEELQARLLDGSTLAEVTAYAVERNQDALNKYTEEEAILEILSTYLWSGGLAEDAIRHSAGIIDARVTYEAEMGFLIVQFIGALWSEDGQFAANVVQRMTALQVAKELNDVFAELLEPEIEAIQAILDEALEGDDAREVVDEVKALVLICLDTFFQWGFSGFEDAVVLDDLEARARRVIERTGSKKNALQALDFAFTEMAIATADRPELSQFVLPMIHLVARGVVETEGGGKLDDDKAIEIFVPVFLNWMILRPFYSQKMIDDLEVLLADAQAYAPDPSINPYQRQGVMYGDYAQAWRRLGDINADAWSALRLQRSIDDFEDWITVAQTAVGVLEVATVASCTYYQSFCDMAEDDIPALMEALNALRVMTNILEFALKLDHLSRMADAVDDLNDMVFATE